MNVYFILTICTNRSGEGEGEGKWQKLQKRAAKDGTEELILIDLNVIHVFLLS